MEDSSLEQKITSSSLGRQRNAYIDSLFYSSHRGVDVAAELPLTRPACDPSWAASRGSPSGWSNLFKAQVNNNASLRLTNRSPSN